MWSNGMGSCRWYHSCTALLLLLLSFPAADVFCIARAMPPLDINSFVVKDGAGQDFPLSQYRNVPAVVIVNVASQCGYTDINYRELQALRANFGEAELAIVAFPCNQFGAQEPGSWSEIASFTDRQYGISFPIMGKVDVNGHQSDPLFAWLKAASGVPGNIPWNFTKFLVVCGNIVKRYSHEVNPMMIEQDIRNAPDMCAENRGSEL